ncbi:MAG: aminoacyltransferase [Sphaerospermopsis sp. SIO1G1]|nr:aminoacyltransferase [Sphaerospermopsis sp. SIO1G1]
MNKQKLLFLLTGIIILIVAVNVVTRPARSQQVDFRVNNLESDLRRLEIRLNQIELLVNKNTQVSPSPLPQSSKRPKISQDTILDRLSTLFVELKQQVNALEKRVDNLEE